MESMLDFSTLPWSCFYLTNPFVGEQVMSTIDALVTFLFGVCLPSWDVYSDMGLSYRFLTNRCYTFKPHQHHEKFLQWKRIHSKLPECQIGTRQEGLWDRYRYGTKICYKPMNETICPTYFKLTREYSNYEKREFTDVRREFEYDTCYKCPKINKGVIADGICDGLLYTPTFGFGIYGNDCGDWSDEEFCNCKIL